MIKDTIESLMELPNDHPDKEKAMQIAWYLDESLMRSAKALAGELVDTELRILVATMADQNSECESGRNRFYAGLK